MSQQPKDQNKQGAHILKSYLGALQIPHAAGETPNEVIVSKVDGEKLRVVVGPVVEGAVNIDAATISSFQMDKSLTALHLVTAAAGYGRPIPVDRGPQTTGRINYNDNFEDVYLRHSIFRRSPNKNEEELAPYMKTIKSSARRAMFRWNNVFGPMGFGEGDLVSVGMVYAISFLHNYAASSELVDNIKLLTEFLNQRFSEMAQTTYRKALNSTCLPQAVRSDRLEDEDGEVSYIETYAESDDAQPDDDYEDDAFILTFPDGTEKTLCVSNSGMMDLTFYLDGVLLPKGEKDALIENIRNGEIKKRFLTVEAEEQEDLSPAARREKARRELHEKLMALDPDKRQLFLGYAALSRDYDPDARRMARRLAEELACPKCHKKVPSGTICQSCEVAAVPRFGVDYVALRKKLADQHHPMAEAMSAQIPQSEQRLRAKKPQIEVTKTLADVIETHQSNFEKATLTMSKEQIDAEVKRMSDEMMSKLPDTMGCPKCKQQLPKNMFGIRVSKDKVSGLPARAARQSYCSPCRRAK